MIGPFVFFRSFQFFLTFNRFRRYDEKTQSGVFCSSAVVVSLGNIGGYRWLKYVPNGILKTAQQAEWKIQAWMIGKPPKITYEGIGFDVKAPLSSASLKNRGNGGNSSNNNNGGGSGDGHTSPNPSPIGLSIYSTTSPHYRPGMNSNSSTGTFSDYDDLADFGGRFESRSTLEPRQRVDSNRTTVDSHHHNHTPPVPPLPPPSSYNGHANTFTNGDRTSKKKPSKGFLRMWRSASTSSTSHSHSGGGGGGGGGVEGSGSNSMATTTAGGSTNGKSSSGSGKRLKQLRSIGSLKTKSSSMKDSGKGRHQQTGSPVVMHQSLNGYGHGQANGHANGYANANGSATASGVRQDEFGDASGKDVNGRPLSSPAGPAKGHRRQSSCSYDRPLTSPSSSPITANFNRRSNGRRSISFTTSTTSYSLSSPTNNSFIASSTGHNNNHTYHSNSSSTNPPKKNKESYQVSLGNALIAASHAESSKGTHTDLLQILNHEQKPWGFSYSKYPHRVQVWYGDKDERIAENAVRWMEQNMGEDRCMVRVVKGADHGLMYKTNVVVDVLEQASLAWQARE